MTHNIDVLGCGVIYIDGIRVFGSKPYGLFSTVTWKATDDDLKRIADRCLEVISDRKDEPSNSEKPNNCEKDCFLCKWLGDVDVCGRCRSRNLFAEADTEPTISKMEQVDKDINVRSKWETPPKFEHKGIITTCVSVPACLLEIEDEPQTERSE